MLGQNLQPPCKNGGNRMCWKQEAWRDRDEATLKVIKDVHDLRPRPWRRARLRGEARCPGGRLPSPLASPHPTERRIKTDARIRWAACAGHGKVCSLQPYTRHADASPSLPPSLPPSFETRVSPCAWRTSPPATLTIPAVATTVYVISPEFLARCRQAALPLARRLSI